MKTKSFKGEIVTVTSGYIKVLLNENTIERYFSKWIDLRDTYVPPEFQLIGLTVRVVFYGKYPKKNHLIPLF